MSGPPPREPKRPPFSYYYNEVQKILKTGEEVRLKLQMTPSNTDSNTDSIRLTYSEVDTMDTTTGVVNTKITISVSSPGELRENDNGVTDELELTSEGYSAEFYFLQLGEQLKILVDNFMSNATEDYLQDIELYVPVKEMSANVADQTVKTNLSKVRGDKKMRYKTPSVGDPGGCNGYVSCNLCSDWTDKGANQCSGNVFENCSEKIYYQCFWYWGSCTDTGQDGENVCSG
jgi:hypothetical protein